MMKRLTVLAVAAALLAACSSGPRANIIQPEMEMYQLVGPADLNYPRGRIEVQYAFRIENRSSEPITLRQVQISPVGAGGPYVVERWTYHLNRTIGPAATEDVAFWVRAFAEGDAYALDANAPVSLRAVAHFDSPAGRFQKILSKTFSQQGAGPKGAQ